MTATHETAVCPRDGAQLVHVERGGVTIDACPTCRGIWLDRGELETLIAQEKDGGDDFLAEVSGRGRAAEGSHRRGSQRRRGSFLENFLDFGGD